MKRRADTPFCTMTKKYIKYFTRMLLLALLGLNHGNLMESLENITKSDSKFHPTFVDHPLLPGMNFNGHCLTKNTFIPKKSKKSIYFLHIRSTINKFKHRFYIK